MKPPETVAIADAETPMIVRAIAYYRSSLEHQSENSITTQQIHVRAWAVKNGIKIIREYSDVGKSGRTGEERPACDEMMDHWVMQRSEFGYILCVNAGRIFRFKVIELLLDALDEKSTGNIE